MLRVAKKYVSVTSMAGPAFWIEPLLIVAPLQNNGRQIVPEIIRVEIEWDVAPSLAVFRLDRQQKYQIGILHEHLAVMPTKNNPLNLVHYSRASSWINEVTANTRGQFMDGVKTFDFSDGAGNGLIIATSKLYCWVQAEASLGDGGVTYTVFFKRRSLSPESVMKLSRTVAS